MNEPIERAVDTAEVSWCLCYELACELLGHPASNAAALYRGLPPEARDRVQETCSGVIATDPLPPNKGWAYQFPEPAPVDWKERLEKTIQDARVADGASPAEESPPASSPAVALLRDELPTGFLDALTEPQKTVVFELIVYPERWPASRIERWSEGLADLAQQLTVFRARQVRHDD